MYVVDADAGPVVTSNPSMSTDTERVTRSAKLKSVFAANAAAWTADPWNSGTPYEYLVVLIVTVAALDDDSVNANASAVWVEKSASTTTAPL